MAESQEHKPTPEQRAVIREAAGFGLPLKYCVKLIGLSDIHTLYKHYQDDIDQGKAEKGLELTRLLHSKCVVDRDTTSLIFALKTQYGFKEGGEVNEDLVKIIKRIVVDNGTQPTDPA